MRITHYLESVRWSIGGVVRAVLDMCSVMAARGNEVEVITYDNTDVPKEWGSGATANPRVKLIDPPGRFGALGPAQKLAIAQSLRATDLLHLHGVWATSNAQAASLARRERKPYIVTVHGMLDDWSMAQKRLKKTLYLSLLGRRVLAGAAAVHCTALEELRQARRQFQNDRAVVIPYVFDLSEFLSLPGPELAVEAHAALRTSARKVLFLSRLHPKKGVEILLRATAILRSRGVDMKLFIAGDGDPTYEQFLRSLVEKLEIGDIVSFFGLVKGATKLSLYQACDVFVLPTSQENFGLVIYESLACGTPVITTREVDISREVEQAGAVLVERTPAAVADAISRLLSNPDKLRELSQRGRAWILEKADGRKTAAELERLYAAVIAEAKNA